MARSRTGRKGNEPRTANQSRQFTNSRDGTPSTQSGRKGGRTSQGPGKQIESVQNGSSTMTTPIQDEHIPLSGFNSAEVEGLLNRGFDAKAASYKSESKTPPGKSDSPWGMKCESCYAK